MNLNILNKIKKDREYSDEEIRSMEDEDHMRRITAATSAYSILDEDERRAFKIYFHLQDEYIERGDK